MSNRGARTKENSESDDSLLLTQHSKSGSTPRYC